MATVRRTTVARSKAAVTKTITELTASIAGLDELRKATSFFPTVILLFAQYFAVEISYKKPFETLFDP